MSKIKIEIKSRWSDKILFEYEKENNTLKDTLEKAILEGTDLRGANLSEANLSEANLIGANLSEANLIGANLIGANLSEANLRGAYLIGANLSEADLSEADLRGADLRGAYLYLWYGDESNINGIIKELENNSNSKIKKYCINKHTLSPFYKIYLENGLIINEYEVVKEHE